MTETRVATPTRMQVDFSTEGADITPRAVWMEATREPSGVLVDHRDRFVGVTLVVDLGPGDARRVEAVLEKYGAEIERMALTDPYERTSGRLWDALLTTILREVDQVTRNEP